MGGVVRLDMRACFAVVAVVFLSLVSVARGDDETPAWVSERLAKAEQRAASDSKKINEMAPTVYADILVYDTKKKGCGGRAGNIGSCIPSDQGIYKREVYMCDRDGQLLISRCTDQECQNCGVPRLDDYGYSLPASRALEDIGCKDDFLKAQC